LRQTVPRGVRWGGAFQSERLTPKLEAKATPVGQNMMIQVLDGVHSAFSRSPFSKVETREGPALRAQVCARVLPRSLGFGWRPSRASRRRRPLPNCATRRGAGDEILGSSRTNNRTVHAIALRSVLSRIGFFRCRPPGQSRLACALNTLRLSHLFRPRGAARLPSFSRTLSSLLGT
jgi:hypothetical protein